MTKVKKLLALPISFFVIATANFIGSTANANSMGVDIYCVMRSGGNSHETSWKAAYHSIKTERGGLFKTSPRQAATIIVESVVGEPDKYKNCVGFLGDLFPDKKPITDKYLNEDTKNNVSITEIIDLDNCNFKLLVL